MCSRCCTFRHNTTSFQSSASNHSTPIMTEEDSLSYLQIVTVCMCHIFLRNKLFPEKLAKLRNGVPFPLDIVLLIDESSLSELQNRIIKKNESSQNIILKTLQSVCTSATIQRQTNHLNISQSIDCILNA